jgi:hypothetical protein
LIPDETFDALKCSATRSTDHGSAVRRCLAGRSEEDAVSSYASLGIEDNHTITPEKPI